MVKFMVTSDNHLGYNETHHICGNDSFETFEEILNLAKEENVDFVLQGGDLFHENKPSRNTYNKTIQILRKYIDEKKENNIIHAIHGNHDDPSGFNSVSPMDILHSTGTVNYFGKALNMNKIEVEPLIINQNNVRIAVYGLGYIKDRRLYRMLMDDKVVFKKDVLANIHILMVHQNRVFRKDSYWPENKIPAWMNLVIFGHEHLSEIVRTNDFSLIQVGSSVRTSLSLDEAGDKFAYFVEIDESSHVLNISRKTLKSVRPFKMETIKVTTNQEIIDHIEEIMEDFSRSRILSKKLPLLRLRIEAPDFTVLNKGAYERMVEGKIANPKEFLRLYLSRKKKEEKEQNNCYNENVSNAHNAVTFESIYTNKLEEAGLSITSKTMFTDALKTFLDKNDKEAFSNEINKNTQNIMRQINFEEIGTENIEEVVKRACEKFSEDAKREKKTVEEYFE